MSTASTPPTNTPRPLTLVDRFLNGIEWLGNKLPDPALLFFWVLLAVWVLSAVLAQYEFTEIDPRTLQVGKDGHSSSPKPIQIKNQLEPDELKAFVSNMVRTFISFPPLGLVLVGMLGVGLAEHVGLINALLKGLMSLTPQKLITPMVMLVAILSHIAGDSGYVVVIPLGGVIFAAAGRHPVAGIVATFAGVAGGFSACFIPTGLDPLLQGLTQSATHIVHPGYQVLVTCNLAFMAGSSLLIIAVGTLITDYVIEPRLRGVAIDGNPEEMPRAEGISRAEIRGLVSAIATFGACCVLIGWVYQESLHKIAEDIVPIIFLVFLLPGIAFGYAAGTVTSHRDIVKGMTKSMSAMSYYLVLAFFAALFSYAFNRSNLGVLLAVKGANFLQALGLADQVTMVGVILITTTINLLIGSASAKWTLLAPIFVPMMMQLNLSPELTQCAFRIGDSSTNIVTPLMPYFPLVVLYCQRYVKGTGIGSLIALMLPYSIAFLITWTVLLLVFWGFDLPLGFPFDAVPDWYYYSGR